jgi:RNA polymerase sigma-70 factor (ECF subfamily)
MSVTGELIGLATAPQLAVEDGTARLGTLFDQHHRRLYRLARRLTPTAEDALDLVQDTFVRVAQSRTNVPAGASSEEAWLVRVLVNLCRDRWRTRARHARLDSHRPERAVTSAHPEAAIVARDTIWRALEALPPRRRAVLVLHELEGADVSDVARLLGISAVTVRWHLSRGRRDLARVIEEAGKP